MNLGIIIDGNRRFISELLEDWGESFRTECFEFTPVKLRLLEGHVNGVRYRTKLRSFLARSDVVFFEWAGPQLAYASRLETATPLVARLHSWELFEFSRQVRWGAVSRVVCVSEAMRKSFLNDFPDQSGKVDVVYPGKSLPRFSPRPKPFRGRMGMVCDLIPVKRVYETVLSLYSLRRNGYDLTLHLAGEPGVGAEDRRYLAGIQRAIERLGLRDRVVFHGWVADTAAWLGDIDIFVSNSYWEGLQNALVEAMAAGCYCLAHFWGGVEEVLPAEYICVTAREMEDKIAAYCDCPESRKGRHHSELRTIVEERFSLPAMLAKMRDILMQAGGDPLADRLRERR